MSNIAKFRKLELVKPKDGYYKDEDVQNYVSELLDENKPISQVPRNDLEYGNVVIVLEGEFASKRVIYLGKHDETSAICVGPRSINNVPLFTINEKFLKKTSLVLKLEKVDIPKNLQVFESKENYFESPSEIFHPSEFEKKIDKLILSAPSSVKYLKTYLKTEFDASKINDLVNANF